MSVIEYMSATRSRRYHGITLDRRRRRHDAFGDGRFTVHALHNRLDRRFHRRQEDLPADVPCRMVERIGKKAAGRELDGRTWDELPKVAA